MDDATPHHEPMPAPSLPASDAAASAPAPFLPPTLASAPHAAPAPAFGAPSIEMTSANFATDPSVVEVPVEAAPAPKRRRVGLLVGAAVLVAAAVVAGVLALGGGESEAYSLKVATASAQQAKNVAFEMQLSAMGTDITMTARIDMERQLMAAEASLPMLSGAGGAFGMVMDLAGKVMYLDAASLGGGAEAPTKWVSMDLSKVPGMEDQLGSLTDANPLDVAKLFDGTNEVKDLGLETVAGEQVRHYVVSVDFDALLKAQPGLFQQVDDLGVDLPDHIDYDVWVTKDNEMRKLAMDMPLMGQELTMEMTVTAIGDIEPIELPAAGEVTDMTDLIGG